MSKKGIVTLIISFVAGVMVFLSYSIVSKTAQKKEVALKIATIPEFTFKTIQEETFTNDSLKEGLFTIFIYFNSTCDFCQHEAQSVSENLESFKDTQILFVSNEPIDLIKDFSKTYQLDNKNQITFLHDSLDVFSAQFDANSIPYILIYNTKSKLIKTHKGQLNASGILKYLNS